MPASNSMNLPRELNCKTAQFNRWFRGFFGDYSIASGYFYPDLKHRPLFPPEPPLSVDRNSFFDRFGGLAGFGQRDALILRQFL
jgi:hypothetical protein